ncbi:MAG TPA: hypothetical protein PLK76_01180 [bacterium]|mgnify:CR=1 FL=1|nr:hypothetical protein [bacterium]
MSKVKAREVLSVSKHGPDYHWFHLVVNGLQTLTVSDAAAVWIVDDTVHKTTAIITRAWEKYDDQKDLVVKRAKITGPEFQILNLLSSLGMGTPEVAAIPWQKNEDAV